MRTLVFWAHLLTGVTAGAVILVMSTTGALLALKPQILRAIDRDVRVVEPRPAPRLPASRLLDAVATWRPSAAQATSITLDRDPAASAAIVAGQRTIYVNPYDATVLGVGSDRAQRFFRTLENWHRWLGAAGEHRALGRSMTGAANLAFLGLAVSGLYLWWPRKWTAQHARPILTFRRGPSGRARDFNWHNVIGFWSAPVIIVMTATGVVMSYPWANALLYRSLGAAPPPPAGERRAPAASDDARRAADARRTESTPSRSIENAPARIDGAWTEADRRMPTWGTITLRLPAASGAPLALTMTDGAYWNAYARSQLVVDSATGDVRQWQPYDRSSLAQKARGWVRFAHTGELGGPAAQAMAGAACAGGTFLVWTGLALACRRLVASRAWRAIRTRGTALAQHQAVPRPPDRESRISREIDGDFSAGARIFPQSRAGRPEES